MASKVNWKSIERKWQKRWASSRLHEADPDPRKPKYFVTAAYPYPNSPQHIGHGRTYTLADVNARYRRMRGYNTLYPMGFHHTGTPIFAMSKRLQKNDPEIIQAFTQVYGVPPRILDRLKDPAAMARYFHREVKKGMQEIGFSIDWRREFATTDPLYSRFIEWHFRTLRDRGLITRGTHPVGWCTNDNGPVGQHDTEGDVEPEIGEFSLLKFESHGVFFPTATLRPETVYGVTNLWVNPQVNYVQARVDGETWIVSKEAVLKLQHQNHKVEVEREVSGKDLLWSEAYNFATHKNVPILPAEFVQAENGSGVVMSVPAHAPYDYQALVDLKSQTGLTDEKAGVVRTVEPIPVIGLDGYSDIPASDAIKKFQITNQKDSHLEEATKHLYGDEFRRGIMTNRAGSHAGLSVAKAREAIVREFEAAGKITRLYEILNRPVFCRCRTECIVHVLENQWFINYGDADWKRLAHQCLDGMLLLPDESRNEFNYTVDWLREKACARKVGLGTRLPWDKEWVIESLSDSVVYMAYYLLVRVFSKNWMVFKKFDKDSIGHLDPFFDYSILGTGTAEDASTKTGVPVSIVKAARREFLYFYAVDMRHSAKDLIPNHLTFYVFNHAILFPSQLWPKGIVANGFVTMEGTKMSKSLQNIIPLRKGISKYGADPVRMGVLATAELGQDTDFSESLVSSIEQRLSGLIGQSVKLRRKLGRPKLSGVDKWMLSRLYGAIADATSAMEKLRVREVVSKALYQLDNDIAWYLRRKGPAKARKDGARDFVLRTVLEKRALLLFPVAPHTAEEVWSRLGNKGIVATAKWPEANADWDQPAVELADALVRQTFDDTREILRTTGISPKRIVYYSASDWKWRIFLKALESSRDPQMDQGSFIKGVMADPEARKVGKLAADYAGKAIQQARAMAEDQGTRVIRTGPVGEKEILQEAIGFLGRELGAPVQIWKEGDADLEDPKKRSVLAQPYRPAIFVDPQ